MLLVIPVSHVDYTRAVELAEWIRDLDEYPTHDALIVGSKTLSTDGVSRIVQELRASKFRNVVAIQLKTEDSRGWPFGPNLMFSTAVNYVTSSNTKSPFLWLESDAIPLKSGWLDALEFEYVKRGRPFMGAIFGKPWTHMTGVAVYPPDIKSHNPYMCSSTKLPFDTVRPDLTLPKASSTNLIEHQWGVVKTNTPPTFPNAVSLSRISPQAVIFHRCKDGSLISRLRESRERIGSPVPSVPDKSVNVTERKSEVLEVVSNERPDLSNVVLWSACWSDDQQLCDRTVRVLQYTWSKLKLEHATFFTHRPPDVHIDFPLEVIQIPKLTMESWNVFHTKMLPYFVKSDFALSVHEDGFPINVSMWRKQFLDYDYIGAPWKDGLVGNGGFCIESRRMIKEKLTLPFHLTPNLASDYYVCRVHRSELERRGIRFAPAEVAALFSAETTNHDRPSFGFHGKTYNPKAYELGWSMIDAMKMDTDVSVTLVYIYVPDIKKFEDNAASFIASYKSFPPGYPHNTIVVTQNRAITEREMSMFSVLQNVSFATHDNTGHDIGAYISAAKSITSDMMVCLGSSTFFRRKDWLARIVQAWKRYGPGVYGTSSSYEISPHLNTNGFACPPSLLASYKKHVSSVVDRYGFEHGDSAFWKEADASGIPVKLVTWDGEYDWQQWRTPRNIFRKGDQSNCVIYWHHHDEYEKSNPRAKMMKSMMTESLTDPLYAEMLKTGEKPKRGWIVKKKWRELRKRSKEHFGLTISNRTSICIAYLVPMDNEDVRTRFRPFVERWIATYKEFYPSTPHELIVCWGCDDPSKEYLQMFNGLTYRSMVYSRHGTDIGATQYCALHSEADMFIGQTSRVYFWKPGWLERMLAARTTYGECLIGTSVSMEHCPLLPHDSPNNNLHMRTFFYSMSTNLWRMYPHRIDTRDHACRFESGEWNWMAWYESKGFDPIVVTWDGIYQKSDWNKIRNGFRHGDQSNMLVHDMHSDMYRDGDVNRKKIMEEWCGFPPPVGG